jgi:PEP-CTERM motif
VSVIPGAFPLGNPNPVPEPSTWMIAVSAMALGLARRHLRADRP